MKLVDLSSWQAGFNFQQAATADGIEGAIVKRTGGTSYTNPYFAQQIAQAQAAGMDVAAYHYMLEPTGDPGSPEDEADHFCAALPSGWVGANALDIEEANGNWPDQNDYVLRFMDRCERNGQPCEIGYTGNYWVQQQNLKDARLAKLKLWLASWQDSVPPVPAGGPWREIWLWQFASRATCGGMTPIDVNDLIGGTREELRAMGADRLTQAQIIAEALPFPTYREAMPTGFELHPYFWGGWELRTHGYPLGPAALYTDGRIRQLMENCVLGSNGRDEPFAFEGLGQAYHRETGRQLVDFAAVHPLVAPGVR